MNVVTYIFSIMNALYQSTSRTTFRKKKVHYFDFLKFIVMTDHQIVMVVYTGMRRKEIASISRSLKQLIFFTNATLMSNRWISSINEIFGRGCCMYKISNHLRLL